MTRSTASSPGSGGTRHASAIEGRGHLRRRAARAGRGDRPEAAVEADVDDLDAPIERVGERGRPTGDRPARVVARRPDVVEQLAERRSRRVAGRRGRGEQDLALAVAVGRLEARQLLRHRAGEEDRQLRAANRRGGDERGDVLDPAALVGSGRLARADEHGVDRRVEDGGGHRQRVDRVGAGRADAPAGPTGGVGERRDGPIRGGDRDEPLRRHAAGDQAGQRRGGPAAVVAERPGQLRVGRLGPLEQQADDRVDVDRRGHRQGADQAPAMADPSDQRGRGGGSPEVEGEEGSGIRHSVIVPAWSPH